MSSQRQTSNRPKILVVDDNQHIRYSIIKLLQDIFFSYDKNYEIVEALDGIDILKSVMDDQKNRNSIKCILTDESMEYMNGSQAIEIIRKMEQQNKIKRTNIISVTSFEDEYNRELILDKGADYIVEKPCGKSSIIKILTELNIL